MQDNRINYVVVGAFVSAMLVAFVVVISILAGRSGATDEYFTVYENVGGVKLGTLVFFEGYQIGQVDEVEPLTDGPRMRFRVTMAVEEGWRIPEDSVARATVSGLLSAIAIDIRGGDSTTMLAPGSEIRGVEGTNIFATLADISAEFGDLSRNSLRPLIDNLNRYVDTFGSTTMEHLPALLRNLENISASLERSSLVVERDILKPANRQRFDTILANFDTTASNLATVSGELEDTRQLLHKSIESINTVVDANAGNVDEAMRSLRYTLDTLARYVDDIAHNADSTARNMAEFSRTIRSNPGLLLRGAPAPDPAPAQTGGR